MENEAEQLRNDVSSCFRQLAKDHPQLEDAQMLVGASDAEASLQRQVIHRSVDVEWIQIIEDTLPYLDLIMRKPTIMIEDAEEVTPVELARHISDKSIRHLAQHTNLIQEVHGDDIRPSKILNIHKEESIETYENKFINTLISRLFLFVTKRYQVISKGFGTQQTYEFQYDTSFTHQEEIGTSNVKIGLHMQLDAPLTKGISQKEQEQNEAYAQQVARAEKIYHTVAAFTRSQFVKRMGANYIRPPVIRTNAILKNKNMRACLDLWEYIEGCEKAGYSEIRDAFQEMPSDDYIRELYTSVALQYVEFYNGVLQDQAANRLLSHEHLEESAPNFTAENISEKDENFDLQDSHYEKIAPISRLMNSRRKLSEDEKKIRTAIDVALKADQLLEKMRLEEEARKAEAKRLAEEAEARRLARKQRPSALQKKQRPSGLRRKRRPSALQKKQRPDALRRRQRPSALQKKQRPSALRKKKRLPVLQRSRSWWPRSWRPCGLPLWRRHRFAPFRKRPCGRLPRRPPENRKRQTVWPKPRLWPKASIIIPGRPMYRCPVRRKRKSLQSLISFTSTKPLCLPSPEVNQILLCLPRLPIGTGTKSVVGSAALCLLKSHEEV